MKPYVLLASLMLGWTALAEPNGSTPPSSRVAMNIHLDVISSYPFFHVEFDPGARGRHDLVHRHFTLRGPTGQGVLILRAQDPAAVAAVIEYLAEREGRRELQFLASSNDIKYIYSFRREPRGAIVSFNWDDLMVRSGEDAIEVGELTAYLRFQQGLFNHNYSKEYVRHVLEGYSTELPPFGRWKKCARLLAHIPWFNY